ncbi:MULTISPECIES: YecA family protein [unclassified Halomonas]|uniref:YecA family protein n=1 Tax=unclassified Halomonas TaxID=2609666 RepID=UPI0021E49188|nr:MULTISPECIES: YecA family protein [unclassified Halomonas]UYF99995.1 YecA family protein [Halomonas sp. GD1P12]WNL38916.1 YecA family protein [Halomonas sp. PAMB 3232]WNL42255.1 YecA family protein [Halomonas sp. PAMB 3264]
MSLIEQRQDFSDVADVFLLHGSMQSPAFLDGRLCALLALRDVTAESWLEEVCMSLGVEQPRDPQSAERLLGWRRQTLDALSANDLNYAPLLPDELFSLGEQAQALKEWALGFTEVIEEVADEALKKRWSQPLKEAIDDLASFGQIETDIDDSPENENDLFALSEHARMAAMLLYTEQHPGQPQVEQTDAPVH